MYSAEKPSPPTNVRIRKNTSTYFQYDITWDQLEKAWEYSVTDYTVQTLAYQGRHRAYFCSCLTQPGETEKFFPFLAGCPGLISQEHFLYYRVAANTDSAGQSDFAHGPNYITIEAGIPYILLYELTNQLAHRMLSCIYPLFLTYILHSFTPLPAQYYVAYDFFCTYASHLLYIIFRRRSTSGK